MFIVEVENLTKYYGTQLALDSVSLKIAKGKSFALLGPNGAGKTTFVRTLLGLTQLSSGSVRINGISCANYRARYGISYLPEKFNFYPYYRVEDVIKFVGKIQGLCGKNLEERSEKALQKMKITDIRLRKMNTLSKGQVQRVGIASLIMGQSDLLILDEPFLGLDPIGIRELKISLNEFNQEGKTILINSHILSEIEKICDEFAILDNGKLLANGKLAELLKEETLEDFFYKKIQG